MPVTQYWMRIRSAPAGQVVTGPIWRTSKWSNVSGSRSVIDSAVTVASFELLRTLSWMVLSSPVPAIAEPSTQFLSPTGSRVGGLLTVTVAEDVTSGAFVAMNVAVFVTVVPPGIWLSCGNCTGILICCVVPPSRPTEPAGDGGEGSGLRKRAVNVPPPGPGLAGVNS